MNTKTQAIDNWIQLVEVGPRDGLQNESKPLSVECRVRLIEQLVNAGVSHIEAGSFVSPKWVPQMANTMRVFEQLQRLDHCTYSALVPNMQGMTAALSAKVDEIAVFAAASETFSQKNINCSIATSLERFVAVIHAAKQQNIQVRGYISCVLGCPYEGKISPMKVASVAESLLKLGCHSLSLGDTIGVGTPKRLQAMLNAVSSNCPKKQLALHCHDTYGQALVNIACALNEGIRTFDSSVAGLGGCPYAKGASGNIATEDLLYFLHKEGMKTGINLPKMIDTGNAISAELNRLSSSKVAAATDRSGINSCFQ